MVRGPMMTEVTARWASGNAVASAGSARPRPSATARPAARRRRACASSSGSAGSNQAGRSAARPSRPAGIAPPVSAGEESEGERAPGQHAHSPALGDREHVALDAARQDVVRRLLGAEPHQAARARRPGATRRSRAAGNVEHPNARILPARTRSVSTAERLLEIGVRVGPVHLVEVDPVGAEPASGWRRRRGAGGGASCRSGWGPRSSREVALGGEDDVVAATAQCLADDRPRTRRRSTCRRCRRS